MLNLDYFNDQIYVQEMFRYVGMYVQNGTLRAIPTKS